MAEKKGFTGKLKYDFPEHKLLEIQLGEKWYRVTPREFRSFDGNRRITSDGVVTEHHGSLYYYNTNTVAAKENTNKTVYSAAFPRKEIVLRPHERHFLDSI